MPNDTDGMDRNLGGGYDPVYGGTHPAPWETDTRDTTLAHPPDCWRLPGHHKCAAAMIEWQWDRIDALNRDLAQECALSRQMQRKRDEARRQCYDPGAGCGT